MAAVATSPIDAMVTRALGKSMPRKGRIDGTATSSTKADTRAASSAMRAAVRGRTRTQSTAMPTPKRVTTAAVCSWAKVAPSSSVASQ